jgi:excisionase family DNA binding protein
MYYTVTLSSAVFELKSTLPRRSPAGLLKRECFNMSDNNSAPRTMTVHRAAKELNTGPDSVYQAVKVGQIPSIRVGRKILIPTAVIERMLNGEAA